MEADSTGLETLSDKGIQDSDIGSTSKTPCEDSTARKAGNISQDATDIDRAMQNVLNITSELFDKPEGVINEQEQDKEAAECSKDIVNVEDDVSCVHENALDKIVLSDQEIISVEEHVLKKYTGLNMDLASENQLLKEDVIQCRCELQKYGKRLSALERKLDRANSYNEDLRQQVDNLSAEVHMYRSEKHKICVHGETQTSADDFMEVGEIFM